MPFDVPCQICGRPNRRTWNPATSGRKATCPGECLRELRRRTGQRLFEEGKIPVVTAEVQRLAAIGRTGRGKGWTQAGYRMVHVDGGQVREHRLVMERHLGRPLRPEEVVHHINENPLDNRIENLRLYANRRAHFTDGHPDLRDRRDRSYIDVSCAECGDTFRTPDNAKRQTLCHKHRRYHRRRD